MLQAHFRCRKTKLVHNTKQELVSYEDTKNIKYIR